MERFVAAAVRAFHHAGNPARGRQTVSYRYDLDGRMSVRTDPVHHDT